MCTSSYSSICIALSQPKFFHAFKENTADSKVYIHVLDTRLRKLQCCIVALFYNLVNLQLFLSELATYWECTGIVRTVVVDRLCSTITESKATCLQYCH